MPHKYSKRVRTAPKRNLSDTDLSLPYYLVKRHMQIIATSHVEHGRYEAFRISLAAWQSVPSIRVTTQTNFSWTHDRPCYTKYKEGEALNAFMTRGNSRKPRDAASITLRPESCLKIHVIQRIFHINKYTCLLKLRYKLVLGTSKLLVPINGAD